MLTISCMRINQKKTWEAVRSYLRRGARVSWRFLLKWTEWKNIPGSVSCFSREWEWRCASKGGGAPGAATRLRILQNEWIISWALMSPGLTSQVLSAARPSALLPFFPLSLAVQKKKKKEKPPHLREPWSLRATPGLLQHCFMHHRFNKHRQHPRRSPLPILPAEGTKLFPLLSSPPNPRLYQLSIKKIQLQFGIRQNTLITKGWYNLILVRGFISGSSIERGEKM